MDERDDSARPALKAAVKKRMVQKGLTLDDMLDRAGIDGRRWRRIVNSGHTLTVQFRNGLQRALDYNDQEIEELLSADDIHLKSYLNKFSFNASRSLESLSLVDLMRDHGDWEKIWNQVEAVYDEWPCPDPEAPWNDFGPSEKWTSIAKESPDTHFVLVENDERVVGFWAFAPVKSETYEEILSGENVNKKFSVTDVDYPFYERDYDIYFIDLFYSKKSGMTGAIFFQYVRRSIQRVLREWGQNRMYIRRVCAHLSTYPAIDLCESLKFKPVVDHKTHTMYGPDGKTPVPTKIYQLLSEDMVKEKEAMRILFSDIPKIEKMYLRKFS